MDFTSALYLGLSHPSGEIPAWKQLSAGKPAVLWEDPAARRIAGALARLQGTASGLVYPSTLHLFWDLFSYWRKQRIVLFLDGDLYPVAAWGTVQLAALGIPIYRFTHRSVDSLYRGIRKHVMRGYYPVIVTDGWCVQCGKAAPLEAYLEMLHPYQGRLVLDDTQALGILGRDRFVSGHGYGTGGGGVLPWLGLADPCILAGSSMAKAFGVPLAILSGAAEILDELKSQSLIRTHCSPVSSAVLGAALAALATNLREGDQRRSILRQRVRQFRNALQSVQPGVRSAFFPVQHLGPMKSEPAKLLHKRLLRQGVRALLTRGPDRLLQLTFLIRADHTEKEIAEAVRILDGEMHRPQTKQFLR
jgi:8-amino-7-oxononanoate synthase